MLKPSVSVGRRGPAFVLLFALAAVYAFSAFGLANQFAQAPKSSLGVATTESTTGDVAAPDDVVQRVANSLQSVIGSDDDLVVLPAKGGTGYTVTVNVTLDSRSPVGTDWKQTVERDISSFFTDVYVENQPIEDAQIFFQLDGHLVAGAGLGRQVYNQLNRETTTNSGGLVQSLQAEPVRTDDGAMDSWVEIVG